MSNSTQTVVERHVHAFHEGVDTVMQDFTDHSVVITPDATYRGLAEIRAFFSALIDGLPAGFSDAFQINHQAIDDEVAFLIWEAKPWFPFCTDTFVVRDGKIRYQAFAGYSTPQ